MHQKRQIALKVDVDTLRGTRHGVPSLIKTLKDHGAMATFLFSLGPDHTGRAIRRIFRRGFLTKVRRTSVTSHYGFRTLLYGTLLPGPDIGARCASILRTVRDEGHEVGVHAWDHVEWQDRVNSATDTWISREITRAVDRFTEIFGESPRTHGAAGWQMPIAAMRCLEKAGFDYCTDGRTSLPFAQAHYPVFRGEIISCPQLPTNLPTLDELIGTPGVGEANVHEHILGLTSPAGTQPPSGDVSHSHVFTLHAELEGQRLLPVFERLLSGWKAQGYELVSTRTLFEAQAAAPLPYMAVDQAGIPGRSGNLMLTTGPWPRPAKLE